MPTAQIGDMQLAWDFGPGFAHACSHFKDPQRSHRASYRARLRQIADEMEKGSLGDVDAAHRVVAATAAFLHHMEKEAVTITVAASEVNESEEAQPGE